MSAPIYRYRAYMKLWQKRMISRLDLPRGSKSAPPAAPPMGSPVRAFL